MTTSEHIESHSAPVEGTPGPSRMPSAIGLGLWIALCTVGGALIGVLTSGGDSAWYLALRKPTWNPPSWVFAPVWTALYAAMGTAAWRVWRHGGWRLQGRPLTLFLAQLALNWAWSCLFFTLQSPALALGNILVLWVCIALTCRLFACVDNAAAWWLAPYLMWVTFATMLNVAIVTMN